jgi:hypothetical protein
MNLSKKNFKVSKKTLLVFKSLEKIDLPISSDPVGTVYGPTTTNSGTGIWHKP